MKYTLDVSITERIDLPLTMETRERAREGRDNDMVVTVKPYEIEDPIIRELVVEKKQTQMLIGFNIKVEVPFIPQIGLKIQKGNTEIEIKNLTYDMNAGTFKCHEQVISPQFQMPHLKIADYIKEKLEKGFTDFNCYKKDIIAQQM
ncbi:MAG: hypothetical protein AABY64_13570 [Bdellovibrionota bacterium]